jgi:hypothetical protein
MTPVTRAHKVYFAFVGLFALWVGVWGYFVPAEISRAIPWQVPPLHARFIGAMYLSGMVLMGLSLVARNQVEVRTAVPMAAIWTGMLLIVSLFHLKEFDYGLTQVWFWFGAYIVYPLVGAWLAYTYRAEQPPKSSSVVPDGVRWYLVAQGIVCVGLAALLFFEPAVMALLWPWRITPLLTQIYSGPFLSYGIGSLLLAWQRHWIDLRIAVTSMFAFAALVLIASYIHLGTFGAFGPSAYLWFGGFGIASVVLGALTYSAMRLGRGLA